MTPADILAGKVPQIKEGNLELFVRTMVSQHLKIDRSPWEPWPPVQAELPLTPEEVLGALDSLLTDAELRLTPDAMRYFPDRCFALRALGVRPAKQLKWFFKTPIPFNWSR